MSSTRFSLSQMFFATGAVALFLGSYQVAYHRGWQASEDALDPYRASEPIVAEFNVVNCELPPGEEMSLVEIAGPGMVAVRKMTFRARSGWWDVAGMIAADALEAWRRADE